ncbi:MAG: hypothetical protein A2Y34_15160 [Spirochaetes bacterium GWC1_27_15]|nr:MAG: hypothetical protein A2Z98_09695 [Spirochaetes bacterium GWB1_27_13]OHD19978.1 MAG: hypothetical protein A2Y34_15160 [Spirochaetes bacterium GWC1_27_15]
MFRFIILVLRILKSSKWKFIKKIGDYLGKKFIEFLTKLCKKDSKEALKEYSSKYKPLVIRDGSSDIMVFWQIFVQNELKLPITIDPKLIIDAGANGGYSALWFAHKYPSAQIVAIEPEESNFEVLRKNTEGYENIKIIKSGLWYKDTYLKVVDDNYGNFGFMVNEVDASEKFDVKAVTIQSILNEFKFEKIDILKIDIEGAEKELFSENYEHWLGKTNVLMVELHEGVKKGCEKSLYSAVNNYKWDEITKGDKKVFIRQNN